MLKAIGKEVNEVVLDPITVKSIVQLRSNIKAFESQILLICTTVLNTKELKGDYSLSPDCTKLTKVSK